MQRTKCEQFFYFIPTTTIIIYLFFHNLRQDCFKLLCMKEKEFGLKTKHAKKLFGNQI